MFLSKVLRRITMIISYVRLLLIKATHPSRFKFSSGRMISVSTTIKIFNKHGVIILGKISTRRNVEFQVDAKGILEIHDDCFFNNNCIISCRDKITIHQGTRFGPGVIVYDHDHDYKQQNGLLDERYIVKEIIIGKNVWLGANCVVLRGSIIGNNSVIAAGTIIKGVIPENSFVYEKRENVIKNYSYTLERN